MKYFRILVLAALAVGVAFQAEAKKVKMQYTFKAGDQFRIEKTSIQDVSQDMMGQTSTTTSTSTNTYEFKVKEVGADGTAVLEAALVGFAINSTNPMGEIKYNSETDTEVPDLAKSTAVMMKEVYVVTMDKFGVVVDVKAPEGIEKKVGKVLEELGGVQMQMAAGAAEKAAGASGFRQVMQSMFITFPKEGAQTGKAWDTEGKLDQMISFQVKTKTQLTKASKTAWEVTETSQIMQDPSNPPMEMQGMTINYELLGSRDGKLVLDPATGLIVSADGVLAISGNISVDSPQLPAPMSIPVTIRSTEKIVKK